MCGGGGGGGGGGSQAFVSLSSAVKKKCEYKNMLNASQYTL